jgi:putative ABC transport system permease protein
VGFSLGMGATILWGMAVKDTTLAFLFPWQLLLFTGGIILIICLLAAGLSIRKVFKIDPKILLGS